jgi:hypothetical protein
MKAEAGRLKSSPAATTPFGTNHDVLVAADVRRRLRGFGLNVLETRSAHLSADARAF